MRVAMAVLADAANVREGMMNVLSAGVSVVNRETYPAHFGVDIAFMLELGKQDLAQPGSVEFSIQIADEDDAVIGSLQGGADWEPYEQGWPMYIPAAIPLRDLELPVPGRYEVRMTVEGLEPIVLHAIATSTESAPPERT